MLKSTKIDRRLASLAALVAALACAFLPAPALAADDLNRIILRVNDEILTLHDYESRKAADVTAILADTKLSTAERQDLIAQLGPRIMQDMFREMLLVSRSKQLRIFISDEEVDAAVTNLAERQGIDDAATLEQALAASGMTLAQLRDKLRREMTWSQVVQREVTALIQIGEEELRAHYRANAEEYSIPEKRWLKEVIVLEASNPDAEELRRLALEIRLELAGGGELEAIIEPYESQGITTGVIDLDWLRFDELDSVLAKVAFELQPGAYSEPVASRGGLHILHLAGLEEAQLRPFEEVADEIFGRERSRRFDQQLRKYLAEIEATSYIREDLPADAVGYRSLAADYTPEGEIELFRQPELPEREESPSEEGETESSESIP